MHYGSMANSNQIVSKLYREKVQNNLFCDLFAFIAVKGRL